MNYEIVYEWLKTTIPGIIILGALGSMVAFFILKLIAWFYRKYFGQFLKRILTPLMQETFVSKIIAHRFTQTEPNKAQYFFIFLIVGFCVTSIFLSSCITITCVYFIVCGSLLTPWLFTIIVLSFLVFYQWLHDGIALVHSLDVFFGQDIVELAKNIKQKHSMDELHAMGQFIDRNLKEVVGQIQNTTDDDKGT